MREDILEKVSVDLLSVPPLIFRAIRTKITRTTLSEAEMNITPHQFEILSLLAEEGTLHPCQIGERLQIAKAQMTKLIDKLVVLNLVAREADETDRRTYKITLTDEARTALEEHKRRVMSAVQELMSALNDDELDNLSLSLRNLRDVLLRSAAAECVTK